MTPNLLNTLLPLGLGMLVAVLLTILLAWLILNGLLFLMKSSIRSKTGKLRTLLGAPRRRPSQ